MYSCNGYHHCKSVTTAPVIRNDNEISVEQFRGAVAVGNVAPKVSFDFCSDEKREL